MILRSVYSHGNVVSTVLEVAIVNPINVFYRIVYACWIVRVHCSA